MAKPKKIEPKIAPAKVEGVIEDRLATLGLSQQDVRLFRSRREGSAARLEEMRRRLRGKEKVKAFPNLVIYAAGSYARGEASEHSDIDLFFVHNDVGTPPIDEPRLKGLRAMSAVISEMEEGLEFPPPSNDGQFFNILQLSDILRHLGGGEDDYRNNFTARMLLLLESTPAFGEEDYAVLVDKVIDSYLRDYEDHSEDFRPTFLVNDILRYWKTLCLNYEHKRNQMNEATKIKHKIKNFKLGFSRMATCYAAIALLASYNSVEKADLVGITKLTPLERFLMLADRVPATKLLLRDALAEYAWFLERTALSTEDLQAYFLDRKNRVEGFGRMKKFGDLIYEVVKVTGEERKTLRFIVV